MTQPDVEPAHDPAAMPRWVPVLIGAILVVMAVLAVYTGWRDRDEDTLLGHVRPKRERRANTSAPPGEPGAGASLVLHGTSGENTPAANEPVQGEARAVVTGGSGGVTSVVRMWARRGMVLDVLPENTIVYVNELPIGEVAQFNTMDEAYEFAAPGSYTIKLVPPRGTGKTYIVTSSEDADSDVVRISAKLE